MPTLQSSSDIAGANQILGGTHNTALNQIGVTPTSGDLMTVDQTVNGLLTRFMPLPILFTGSGSTGWANALTSGGAATFTSIFGQITTSTTTGSGVCSFVSFPCGTTGIAGTSGSFRTMNFSREFWLKFNVIGNTASNSVTNTVFRVCIGKNINTAPALGPTSGVKSVGFKILIPSSGVGNLYGEVNDGTTLTTSSSSIFAFSSFSGANKYDQILMHSLGNGTVQYYVDGTLAGTLTGGPTGTGGAASEGMTVEIVNNGDTVACTVDFATPSIYVVG